MDDEDVTHVLNPLQMTLGKYNQCKYCHKLLIYSCPTSNSSDNYNYDLNYLNVIIHFQKTKQKVLEQLEMVKQLKFKTNIKIKVM